MPRPPLTTILHHGESCLAYLRRSNKRTDAYGGSPENMFRLADECLAAILEVWPAGRVGVKLSPNGTYGDMGTPDFRQNYLYYFSRLEDMGLAYLQVMDGLAFGFHGHGEAMTLEEIRKVYSGVVFCNAGYDGPTGEAAVVAGKAEGVALGRAFIANPDLVRRLKEGLPLAEPKEGWKFFYSNGVEGYTDYPAYDQQMEVAAEGSERPS